MGAFQTTRWSLIVASRDASREGAAALDELCRIYRAPVLAYVRHRGYGSDDAEELTQSFFEYLLGRGMVHRADPARGSFRAFLVSSIRHFLSDARSADRARKRGGDAVRVPLDEHDAAAPDADTPEAAFDRAFALTVLARAMSALEREAREARRLALFERAQALPRGSPRSRRLRRGRGEARPAPQHRRGRDPPPARAPAAARASGARRDRGFRRAGRRGAARARPRLRRGGVIATRASGPEPGRAASAWSAPIPRAVRRTRTRSARRAGRWSRRRARARTRATRCRGCAATTATRSMRTCGARATRRTSRTERAARSSRTCSQRVRRVDPRAHGRFREFLLGRAHRLPRGRLAQRRGNRAARRDARVRARRARGAASARARARRHAGAGVRARLRARAARARHAAPARRGGARRPPRAVRAARAAT